MFVFGEKDWSHIRKSTSHHSRNNRNNACVNGKQQTVLIVTGLESSRGGGGSRPRSCENQNTFGIEVRIKNGNNYHLLVTCRGLV